MANADLLAAEIVNDIQQLQEDVLAFLLVEFGTLGLPESLAVNFVVEATPLLLCFPFEHLSHALALNHGHDEVHGALHLIVKGVVHLDNVFVVDAPEQLVLLVGDLDQLDIVGPNDLNGQSLPLLLLATGHLCRRTRALRSLATDGSQGQLDRCLFFAVPELHAVARRRRGTFAGDLQAGG